MDKTDSGTVDNMLATAVLVSPVAFEISTKFDFASANAAVRSANHVMKRHPYTRTYVTQSR